MIGVLWAIIQPLLTMVIFSIFFGGLAGVLADEIPYPILSFAVGIIVAGDILTDSGLPGLILILFFSNLIYLLEARELFMRGLEAVLYCADKKQEIR